MKLCDMNKLKIMMIMALITFVSITYIPVHADEIHDAAASGNLEKVKAILKKNPEMIHLRDKDRLYGRIPVPGMEKEETVPLYGSVEGDLREIDESVLKKAKKLTYYNGSAPLHKAAASGRFEVARYLIEKGADVNAIRGIRNTPLHEAVQNGDAKLVALLLDNGADIREIYCNGNTLIHEASEHGKNDLVKLLLSRGFDIEAKDHIAGTALHLAAAYGHDDVVKTLLKAGCDPAERDIKGRTPEDRAKKQGHEGIARLLDEAAKNPGKPIEEINAGIPGTSSHPPYTLYGAALCGLIVILGIILGVKIKKAGN